MHFVYIDESGNTSVNDRYQRFFVLAALVARGADCLALEERFNILKAKHFPGLVPEQIEIKGRNLIYGHEFFDKVKPEIRGALLAELHKILGGHSLSLLATILDKGHDSLQRLNLVPDDVYRYAYKNLIRRVDEFLRTQNSEGLLLIDSRASSIHSHLQDGRVMAIHREYLQGIKREPGGTCIVEYPVFVQSQFFGAVQLADLCAYQLFHASQTNPNIQDICSLEPNDGNLRLVLRSPFICMGIELC